MIKSLLRKIIYVILLLWIVSLISFWLSNQVPGDEVMDYISIDERGYNPNVDPNQFRTIYQRVAKLRGLDLPGFYFSIHPRYIPDTVQHILPLDDRKVVKQWIHYSGHGEAAGNLYIQLRSGLSKYCGIDRILCQHFNQSLAENDIVNVRSNSMSLIDSLKKDSIRNEIAIQELSSVVQSTNDLLTPRKWNAGKIIPAIRWNGSNNQYHHWMMGLVLQKPLISLVDGRNAWSKIYDSLKWTLLLNGFAFIISMLLGVVIGIWSAIRNGQKQEKIVNWILFALFALPSFWLGTLFIYFFASGEWISILPSGGLGPYHAASNLLERWFIIGTHLLLPVVCLALGALAYVSRQMKQSVLHEYSQPYVTMLRSQGISEKTILRKHVIGNALFPVITMMGGAIPALISGSLIIEVIFSVPGMGRLMFNSLMSKDWPVAFPILMFGAFITILSYIITDIIYKWADPRVKVLQP